MDLSREYDGWYQQVFEADPSHSDESSPWYRLVSEFLPPLDGKRVLEVACGRGGFVRLLASRGAAAFGTDFSAFALKLARERIGAGNAEPGRASFTRADAQQLPYADESFDIVISCETVEHLLDPASALLEMARVSRPGGLLFLTTPNYMNLMGLYYLYARLRQRKLSPGSDQPIDRAFLFPHVRRLVRLAGWEILSSDGTVHQFPIWPGRNPLRAMWMESHRSVRRLLSPFALHYFLLGRKRNPR